jgi:hypothetical protein
LRIWGKEVENIVRGYGKINNDLPLVVLVGAGDVPVETYLDVNVQFSSRFWYSYHYQRVAKQYLLAFRFVAAQCHNTDPHLGPKQSDYRLSSICPDLP